MKKKSRKAIVKQLDNIVSLYVRELENYTCFICGLKEKEKMQCGHLFSRIAYSTRWSLLNCHCSCSGCNFKHELDFEPYRRKFVMKYGEIRYNDLYQQFRTPKKYSNSELLEMIEEFKTKLKYLRDELN